MDQGTKPPFRFLTSEEFSGLDLKEKALYLVCAQQELEAQRDILRQHREDVTAEVAAIAKLPGGLPRSDTRQ